MRRQNGFTLVGLLITVAIVNLVLAAVVTSWVTLDRRAREAELLWRGQQIARAIDCYNRDNGTEPLERLDQLVQANCLRRVYRDPMSKSGQWRILTQQDLADGTIAALLGNVPAGGTGGPAAIGSVGTVPRSGSSVGLAQQGTGFGARGGLGQGARTGFPQTAGFGDRGGVAGAGATVIVGVVSTAPGKGLRTYRGREPYREWVFIAAGGA